MNMEVYLKTHKFIPHNKLKKAAVPRFIAHGCATISIKNVANCAARE